MRRKLNDYIFSFTSVLSRGAVLLVIVASLCAGGAFAREADEPPDISDIRLVRKLGEYDRALGHVRTILEDDSVPDDIRRQAYNELVTIIHLTEGGDGARAAAREALAEFPDLDADPYHHPAEIKNIYDELRGEMFGRLHLSSSPDRCEVYVDGKAAGVTPLDGIYVPAGAHKLRFSKFGYEDVTLEVNVEPGGTYEHAVTLGLYRDIPRLAGGFELGLSLVSLGFGKGRLFAGVGTASDTEMDYRFGGGVFLHFLRHDRLAFHVGVRYISLGNRAYIDMLGAPESGKYKSHHRYLAASTLMKYYVFKKPRLCLCFGPEFSLLMSAELSMTGGGDSVDILENLEQYQISILAGAGYEIAIGNHVNIMFSVLRNTGLVSLRKGTRKNDIDYKPREWKFTVGLMIY